MARPTRGGYAVYAHASASNETKRIRLTRLLAIDAEGKIVLEGHGSVTIGSYEGRISEKKVKNAVISFATSELRSRGYKGDVSFADMVSPLRIERLLSRTKSGRREAYRKTR